jgi:flagellar hook-basal body complex protein FliE
MTGSLALSAQPGAAAQAYQTASGLQTAGGAGGGGTGSFSAMLGDALDGAIATGHAADRQAMAAIEGHGNITDVVTAISKAELALQTTSAIRDKMVSAYQDIMRMPI